MTQTLADSGNRAAQTLEHTMTVTYVHLPAIPGAPTCHTGARQTRSAEREIRNATKAGYGDGAYLRSVTLVA